MAVALVTQAAPQVGTTQTMAIAVPTGIVTGNVLIFTGAHGGTLGAMPAGVTLKHNAQGQFVAWITTAAHIAAGSPASYTFTVTSALSDVLTGHCVQWSGTDLTDPFDVTPVTGTSAGVTTGPDLTLTTVTANTRLVLYDAWKSAARTYSSVTAPIVLFADWPTGNQTMHGGHGAFVGPGATGNLKFTMTVGSSHNAILYALREPTGGGGTDLGDVMISGTKKDITSDEYVIGGVAKARTSDAVVVGGVSKSVTARLAATVTAARGGSGPTRIRLAVLRVRRTRRSQPCTCSLRSPSRGCRPSPSGLAECSSRRARPPCTSARHLLHSGFPPRYRQKVPTFGMR